MRARHEYLGDEGKPASAEEIRAAGDARKALMERRDLTFEQKETIRNAAPGLLLRNLLESAVKNPAKAARRTGKAVASAPNVPAPVEKAVRKTVSTAAAEFIVNG